MLVYNASIAATSLCAVWARLTSLRRSFGLAGQRRRYRSERNMT
jgi:hypothetical protein